MAGRHILENAVLVAHQLVLSSRLTEVRGFESRKIDSFFSSCCFCCCFLVVFVCRGKTKSESVGKQNPRKMVELREC